MNRLLVANRGEIAIRIARAASELGITTVSIYGEDDAASLHTRVADTAVPLIGTGVAAYLDADQIVALAVEYGCDAVHPGYGFLAENAEFAAACADAGLVFVGPTVRQLALFGDKVEARALAAQLHVPLLDATAGSTSLDDAEHFLDEHGAMMIKAVAGGGGRGMRPVRRGDDVAAAYERCVSEAAAAFGTGEVYVERLVEAARHVEIQVVGDGTVVAHLGERECSLQRHHQKLVEIAPAPSLPDETRALLEESAVRMAGHTGYRSVGTWEFLVDAVDPSVVSFVEANARLQVEHTVTEEITGIDLVQAQLRIADGASLADLGLTQDRIPAPRGFAVQCRVNTETMAPDGTARPSGGTLTAFEPPSGPGVRTDTYGYAGYSTNPSFDSMLAKVVAHCLDTDVVAAANRARRALTEFRIEGVATNIGFLQAVLARPEIGAGTVTTRFIADHASELVAGDVAERFFPVADTATGRAGSVVDDDPLAVIRHGHGQPSSGTTDDRVGASTVSGPAGSSAVEAPLQGTVVSISVREGDVVAAGQPVAVMEAMKMEHVIVSTVTGVVRRVGVAPGEVIYESHPLVFVEEADVDVGDIETAVDVDLDHIRSDLREVYERHAKGMDASKPAAVAKRHARGHRTARENLDHLVDDGTFLEYGSLMVAAQRRRRELEDLIDNTQGDGMVAGIGCVNGALFGPERSKAVVMSYDYMVLAGTQGLQNHRKKDRLFEIAEQNELPVVLLAEGGGGRPGDTDGAGGSGLDCLAFTYFAKLSGQVPLVGIANGYCFAGNAVLLGCCDVIIATRGSNIGVGGPAMIEGGGLGVFRPDEVGPAEIQVANGVIDVLVDDESEAVDVARRYLAYFQGPVENWDAHDERSLRHLIPENRLRAYDIRAVIDQLCDVDSVLELRRGWGPGVVTALARIEGRPVGVVANDNHHLGGAIDADAADKGSRFMQLCDAHDIPIVFLCDTPGIMVGPQAEHDATVRHAARMFVTSASIGVRFMTIVLRKGYGLGAQAMAGGSFKAPIFTVAWPTGEFGGMGLEGFVKLGYRKELEAEADPVARKELYDKMVDRLYQNGKAVSTATYFEIDDVIDPADSRRWIMMGLEASPERRRTRHRSMIDTW